MNPIGVLLCDDLLFTSRIVGTANALGLTLDAVKSVVELEGFLRKSTPRCVILDLQTADLNIDELSKKIAAFAPRPMLIGYGSHVDAATLKRARDAGFDVVWPRSKFVDDLATALPSWFNAPEAKP
jgi:DNA-binding NarL/FixJ family response regulator